MAKSVVRKEKIVLCNTQNDNDVVTITINIDSNHVNNAFDQLLQTMSNYSNAVPGYKVQEPEKKSKSKKKNQFGDGGQYV
jgi:hypothetical protein